MPNYSYCCPNCQGTEDVLKPLRCLENVEHCLECGVPMKRIIVQGHGGTLGDEAPWVHSTNDAITGEGQRPVTNRTEYKQRCKELEAKGIYPVG